MSIILAVAAVVMLIAFDVIRRKNRLPVAKPVLVERYVHAGHTWARMTNDGYVLVGIDDFAQSLIGSVDDVALPHLLKRVHQGKIGWQVRHGGRLVSLASPVTGWVVEKNEMVVNNPSLVNTSPYGDGWILRIKPSQWSRQFAGLLTGKAFARWQDLAKAQLAQIFTGTPALMYQDGGLMMKNLCDRCSEEEWQKVASQFLLVDQPQHPM